MSLKGRYSTEWKMESLKWTNTIFHSVIQSCSHKYIHHFHNNPQTYLGSSKSRLSKKYKFYKDGNELNCQDHKWVFQLESTSTSHQQRVVKKITRKIDMPASQKKKLLKKFKRKHGSLDGVPSQIVVHRRVTM